MADRMRWNGIVGLLLGLAACGDAGAGAGAGPGQEGGPCVDGTCLQGLKCLSNICVDPGTETSDDSVTGPEPTTTATGSATNTTQTTNTTDDETTGPVATTDLPGTTPGTTSDGTSEDFPPYCGDSVVDAGEECDDGPANDDKSACKSDCSLQACGDGHKGPGEVCDDGNNDNGDACNKDCVVPKSVQWVQHIQGIENGSESAEAVGVDGDNNVIAGGIMSVPGPTFDSWLAKFSPGGDVLWEQTITHDGPNDRVDDLAVDPAGHIFAGGWESSEKVSRSWLRRFAADGTQEWEVTHDSDLDGADTIRGVVIASNGDVIAAGHVPGVGIHSDAWIRRLTSDGDEVWTTTWDNPDAHQTDDGYALAIAPNDDVVVAGRTSMPGLNYLALRVSGDGVPLWGRFFDYMNKSDIAEGVAADADGNVVVVGNGDADQQSVKYTPDGTQAWVFQSWDRSARAATFDGAGNVYIAGGSGTTNIDLWVQVVSPAGDPLWEWTYDLDGEDEAAFAVALDGFGNVILAGTTHNNVDYTNDILVLKYAPE